MTKIYMRPRMIERAKAHGVAEGVLKRRPLVGQRIVRVAQDADAINRKKKGAKEPSLPKLKFLDTN